MGVGGSHLKPCKKISPSDPVDRLPRIGSVLYAYSFPSLERTLLGSLKVTIGIKPWFV